MAYVPRLRWNGTLVLAIALVVGAISFQWSISQEETQNRPQQPTSGNSSLEERISAIEKKMDYVLAQLTLSQELENQLKQIESILNDPTKWPWDTHGVEELRKKFERLVHQLSPLVSHTHKAYLVRLGWGIEALWCLRHYRFVWRLEEVVEAIEIFDDLLERYPRGFFYSLKLQLETRLRELEKNKSQLECQHLETEAIDLLRTPDCPPERIQSLLQRLRVYSDHPRLRTCIEKLSKYHQRAVVTKRLKELSDRIQALRSNDNLSAEEKLAAFSALKEQLLQTLLEAEFDENQKDPFLLRKGRAYLLTCQDQIRHWTRVIAKREAEEQAANLRAYQQWALWQILQFNGRGEVWGKERIWGWHYDVIQPWVDQELRAFGAGKRPDPYEWSLLAEFPNAAKLLKEKLGVDIPGSSLSKKDQQAIFNSANQRLPGWRGNIDRELAYLTTRDGMVRFLLPIQTHLLEPPVMELYQRAFQAGWKTLEDHTTFQDDGPDQLYVAKMSAIVRKKTLDEAVEELKKLTNPGK